MGNVTLSDPNGVITSPGFPNDYPANSKVSWLIQLPPGRFIEVNFISFELPICKGDDCNYLFSCTSDTLKIYNGASDASPAIGKFTGKLSGNLPKVDVQI